MTVYMVRAGSYGPVKIGVTEKDVSDRLKGLQRGHYETLNLLRTIEGGVYTEEWLHDYFAPLQVQYEWFIWSPEMLTIEVPDVEGLRFTGHPSSLPFPANVHASMRIKKLSRGDLVHHTRADINAVGTWLRGSPVPLRFAESLSAQLEIPVSNLHTTKFSTIQDKTSRYEHVKMALAEVVAA